MRRNDAGVISGEIVEAKLRAVWKWKRAKAIFDRYGRQEIVLASMRILGSDVGCRSSRVSLARWRISMRLKAPVASCKSARERMRHGGIRQGGPFGLVLLLAACSGVQLTAQAPRSPSLRVADAALASGAPDVALRVADLQLALAPHAAPALAARGDALYAMGQRELARSAYQAAIAVDPRAAGAQLGLGRTLAQSDPRGAESAFLQALAQEPGNVLALNNLGVVRDMQAHHAEAQEAYLRALALAPESMDVRINLGMSLALSGRRSEALALLAGVAAVPGVAESWRSELLAGLTLAGGAPMARQMLADAAQLSTTTPQTEQPASPGSAPSAIVPVASPVGSAKTATAGDLSTSLVAMAAPHSALKGLIAAPRTAVQRLDLPVVSEASEPAIRPVFRVETAPALLDSSSEQVASVVTQPSVAAAPATVTVATVPAVRPTTLPATEPRGMAAAPVGLDARSPYVQIASLLSAEDAAAEWGRLSNRLAPLLAGRNPVVTPATVRGRSWWRLRTFGFVDQAEADTLCGRIKAAGFGCWSGKGL